MGIEMTDQMEKIKIRPATQKDVPLILSLIKDLAAYERLSNEVVATEDILFDSLFGKRRFAEVIIGYYDSVATGYALFFHNFSTFIGKPGIYIEDLYVKEAYRGKGVGRSMLVYVAQLAKARNCKRLEFSVLNWNEPAIRFYEHFGARSMDDWMLFRMTGKALDNFAAGKGFSDERYPEGLP